MHRNFELHHSVLHTIAAFEEAMAHLTRTSIFDVVYSDAGADVEVIAMRSIKHIVCVDACPWRYKVSVGKIYRQYNSELNSNNAYAVLRTCKLVIHCEVGSCCFSPSHT